MSTTVAVELQWPACRNVRDLGGFVRADDLSALDDEGVEAMAAYGVSTVIDLRSQHELAESAHPWRNRVAYRNVPLVDEAGDADRMATRESTKSGTYCASIDRNARLIVAGLRAAVNAPPGRVVIHCAAGRDRTGMAVALLLDLMGVPRLDIAADYAASDPDSDVEAALQRASAAVAGSERARLTEWYRCQPQTILAMLEHVDVKYGGSAAYALRHDMTLDELATVRDRFRR